MKTTFKIKSKSNFVDFLGRFESIAKSMVLEMRSNQLMCKSATGDKCVMKTSKMPLADVLEGDIEDPIKVFIYDIKRITSVFKHFKPQDEISLEVEHEKISGDEVAISLTFKTKATKIKIQCGDMTLFAFIADDMLKKIVKRSVDAKKVEFPFPKDSYSSISGLCGLDDSKDPITILVKDGEIMFKGKSYEQNVGDAPTVPETDFVMLNEHFHMIEPETSTFMLCGDSMLVKSQESETIVIIGRVEPNVA